MEEEIPASLIGDFARLGRVRTYGFTRGLVKPLDLTLGDDGQASGIYMDPRSTENRRHSPGTPLSGAVPRS